MGVPNTWPAGWGVALLIVAGIGGFVGATDIVRKYRDAPRRALETQPAWLYIAVNVVASMLALVLIWTFNWTFERDASQPAQVLAVQVLVAGLSAMVLLRSAVFTVHQDGVEVPIGPANILDTILGAADRAVDRIRAEARANSIAAEMGGIAFDRASIELPVIALALMRTLSKEDQEILGNQVKKLIESTDVSNEGKCLALGLALDTFVGSEVLKAAIKSVKSQISQVPVIVGVDPASIEPAAVTANGHVRLLVSGQNFRPDSRIKVDDVLLPTTFVAVTHLAADLPTESLTAPGRHRVTVITPTPGGESNDLALLVQVNGTPATPRSGSTGPTSAGPLGPTGSPTSALGHQNGVSGPAPAQPGSTGTARG
jgi:IPT/TIG domain